MKSDIKNCSQFYFLESIKIEQLSMERKLITVEEDYLQSLVTREVMTDDYDSHDKIIPQYSFPYNSRLNVANLKKYCSEVIMPIRYSITAMDMLRIGLMLHLL